MLVGDDRVHLEAVRRGNWCVRPARELAGLIEIRGLGHPPLRLRGRGLVGLVVDLAAEDAERLPPPAALRTVIAGVELPRIPVGAGLCAASPGGGRTDYSREFTPPINGRLPEGNW